MPIPVGNNRGSDWWLVGSWRLECILTRFVTWLLEKAWRFWNQIIFWKVRNPFGRKNIPFFGAKENPGKHPIKHPGLTSFFFLPSLQKYWLFEIIWNQQTLLSPPTRRSKWIFQLQILGTQARPSRQPKVKTIPATNHSFQAMHMRAFFCSPVMRWGWQWRKLPLCHGNSTSLALWYLGWRCPPCGHLPKTCRDFSNVKWAGGGTGL